MQTFTDLKKCSSCRCWKPKQDYINQKGRILKTCLRCRIKITDPWDLEDFNMPEDEENEELTIFDLLKGAFNDTTYNNKYNYIVNFLESNKEWWWLVWEVLEKGEIDV